MGNRACAQAVRVPVAQVSMDSTIEVERTQSESSIDASISLADFRQRYIHAAAVPRGERPLEGNPLEEVAICRTFSDSSVESIDNSISLADFRHRYVHTDINRTGCNVDMTSSKIPLRPRHSELEAVVDSGERDTTAPLPRLLGSFRGR